MRKILLSLACFLLVFLVSFNFTLARVNPPSPETPEAASRGTEVRNQAQEVLAEKEQAANLLHRGWKQEYNPRSETARQHMSIVAKSVESLLLSADRLEDPGIGEKVREIAREHGETSEEIAQKQDQINQRSGVAKFFFGPDYTALGEVKQLMEQIRNKIRELNQIRTQLQNQAEEQEIQNRIRVLEMEMTSLQNYVDGEEATFSLFGWLVKLFK